MQSMNLASYSICLKLGAKYVFEDNYVLSTSTSIPSVLNPSFYHIKHLKISADSKFQDIDLNSFQPPPLPPPPQKKIPIH